LEELAGRKGSTFQVFSEIRGDQDTSHKIGIERQGKNWRARLDGRDVAQLSQLTRQLPLVLLEPESHRLVNGAPEVRRKYLDWGLFHVEHGFIDVYRQYSRLLKQRNAALRRSQSDVIESIDPLLAKWGDKLSACRQRIVSTLGTDIQDCLGLLSPALPPVYLEYVPGWSGASLEETWAVTVQRDMERGSTGEGPHRGDLVMKTDRTPVKQVFSRGEQKVLAAAMIMAQQRMMSRQGGKPLVLFDDLASEFDESHFKRVLDMSLTGGNQVWLTGTDLPRLAQQHKVFHVKRGEVSEVV
jgi:DNA replication and repair protein RecF